MYSLTQTVAPVAQPVTTEKVRNHLRIVGTEQDADLEGLYIPAAVSAIEKATGRQLITATWRLGLNEWPLERDYVKHYAISLPLGKLQAVTGITYIDGSGDRVTLAADQYQVFSDHEPALVMPIYGQAWPAARIEPSSIQVTFRCGYGDAATNVPIGLQNAVCIMAAHLYEVGREAMVTGTIIAEVPLAIQRLIENFTLGDEWEDYSGSYVPRFYSRT